MAANLLVIHGMSFLLLSCYSALSAKYVRGMYAVRVKGRIPEDVLAELESRGFKYSSRDQSDQD